MKTENQTERDKANGIINLEHSFDQKTGTIVTKGLIRKTVNPEEVIAAIEPVKQKLNALKEHIVVLKEGLKSAPVSCDAAVLEFLETQKNAALWKKAEADREQIKQRQKEYDVLTDDLVEQEKLLEEYLRWKKK